MRVFRDLSYGDVLMEIKRPQVYLQLDTLGGLAVSGRGQARNEDPWVMSSNLETDTLSRWAMLAAIAQCFPIERSPKISKSTSALYNMAAESQLLGSCGD
jgi:hypothetical protein